MKSIAILLLSIFFTLIEKNDHVATSEGGKTPDQYELFLQLNHFATTQELLELLNYKNGLHDSFGNSGIY